VAARAGTEGISMATTDESTKNLAIVTTLGNDRSGIVAAVSQTLAEAGVNIMNISQTIMDGIFTMTMQVSLRDATKEFTRIQEELNRVAKEINLQIVMQREEVFNFMYRL
jgi:ACT domain-containing protein